MLFYPCVCTDSVRLKCIKVSWIGVMSKEPILLQPDVACFLVLGYRFAIKKKPPEYSDRGSFPYFKLGNPLLQGLLPPPGFGDITHDGCDTGRLPLVILEQNDGKGAGQLPTVTVQGRHR